ncbi:MAG: hypothetical protein CMJ78_06730 [Planctomycetaceae bacterium]|nr:hypothetical protein [Planctomycetaceae bacterium]
MAAGSSGLRVFGEQSTNVNYRDRPAAYAVITNSANQVAVVEACFRDHRQLWLPGGGIEAGESPMETIESEIREELGREVSLQEELAQSIQFFYADDDQCWYKMHAHFYAADFAGPQLEASEFELLWVAPIACGSRFFHQSHAWAAQGCVE